VIAADVVRPRDCSSSLYANRMEYILKFNELEKYFEKADFTDVKVFEGETTLRKFIASMLSYYPWYPQDTGKNSWPR